MKEIEDVIIEFLDADCWQLIVPNKIYHAMKKRGRCCGCFPNVVNIIINTTEKYHENRNSDKKVIEYINRVRQFNEKYASLNRTRPEIENVVCTN